MKNEIAKHTTKLNEYLVRELEFYNNTDNFRYNLRTTWLIVSIRNKRLVVIYQ